MRRVLFGFLWFIAIFIALYLVYTIGVAIYMLHASNISDPHDTQAIVAASSRFVQEHGLLLRVCQLLVLLLSVLAAVVGTITSHLPGTRKRPAST